MSTQILRRRGSAVAHSSFVGGTGELTVDTTNFVVRLHDSSTTGGFPLHKFASSITTLTANALIFADSTTTLNQSSLLLWTGTSLDIAASLILTGAQTFKTSSGTLTITGTGGTVLTTVANTNIQINPNGTGNINCTLGNATGTTTSSSFVLSTNSLTTGTGLYVASSTLTSGLLVNLQVSGTAAAASQTALNILTAGATATNAITTYGAQISNTHTNATSGTNVALYLNASGATTANYGLIVNAGRSGFGVTAPDGVVDVRDGNFVLSDADVAHGMTAYAATNVYGRFGAYDTNKGGLQTMGLSDSADTPAIFYYGLVGGTPTTAPAIWFLGGKKNGTADQNLATTEKIFALSNNGAADYITVLGDGKTGFGSTMTAPNYQIEVGTDSAGKPGVGGLWTVVSDKRIKKDIVSADLDRCLDIVKTTPLKYFGWADGVYDDSQVKDKHCLGWVAQDVQVSFPKAVGAVKFKKAQVPNGTEEFQIPDSSGGTITKTRPKFTQEVIEDCLDLNGGQMLMALYGAVQKLIQKVEALEQP